MGPVSRTNQLAAQLRDEILRGRYRAGERLPSERDLAGRFGVHRGAAREALKKLEQLGVVDIQRGGARVAPLAEASLDVVEHLLDLDEIPDPKLVEQMLEVFGALMATAVGLGIERGTDAQLERAQQIIDAIGDPSIDSENYLALLHDLGDTFYEAADNLVLRLARNGIRLSLIGRLGRFGISVLPQSSQLNVRAMEFRDAIGRRDATAASEEMHRLLALTRENIVKSLESLRAGADSEVDRS
ncbi:MAG: GntR family transcriptional regulator [Myxococcota bacterium]|jgi:DNA-binding FadR family transcriptional regulator